LVDAQSIQPGVESSFFPEEPQIFAIVAPNVLCGRQQKRAGGFVAGKVSALMRTRHS
jgi:hypothetical protein